MKIIGLISCVALLGSALAVPATVAADTRFEGRAKTHVTAQLKEAKEKSYKLSKNADALNAITRSRDLAWQSHASYLNSVRDDVNQLGKMFAALEEVKHDASAPQQVAIEDSKVRLQRTADSISEAIALLNDRTRNVYFSDYGEAVQSINEHTRSLHETLDAIVKLEDAKAGFEKLDLGIVANLVDH